MKKAIGFAITSILLWPSVVGHALEPANPNTNAKARAILNYLENLPKRSEKRVISGQFTNYGRGANLRQLNEVFDKTGHWPGMVGADYADFGKGGLHCQTVNQVAIEYWNKGGLVTLSTHMYNPARPGGGGLRDKGVDLNQLLTPGNDAYTRWMEELDTLAAGLNELKDAGVVVLWRPFHEMNGGWFWWGGKDPATFVKVWRHMFDYFTKTKRLDNLLWVYGPNHGANAAAYYPGDSYADVVGLDAYTDYIDKQHIKGYDDIIKLGKPFGFTEFGPHGSSNPPGDYDYRQFIEGITKEFPRTTFFLSWQGGWSLARNRNVKEMLEHPWIANREDIGGAFGVSGK
jgi:mannan endo-1,4-beta-mannosidase